MSKLFYFATNAALFFGDAVIKRFGWSVASSTQNIQKVPTFVIGFSPWKGYLREWFPERELLFLPRFISSYEFKKRYWKYILADERSEVFIWGIKASSGILKLLKENNVKKHHIEDGFIRSIQLGSTRTPPYSLTIDSKTPYFDATQASDLEDILNNYDFENDIELMANAEIMIKQLIETGISKYNNSASVDIKTLYGKKEKKRILVIGQVENDASIKLGCEQALTNNDVVRLAAAENPDAQIIYKPHPDIMNGYRKRKSHPKDVKNICMVLQKDIPISEALKTIDHVYTITSLAGFEALLRGIKVTTLGCPFYAGWGVTDTRQHNVRRERKLTPQQIFAAAYLLYAKYFDPNSKRQTTIVKTIERLMLAK
jgi:capsule polysaccharide export protein KpsC/LpsZ